MYLIVFQRIGLEFLWHIVYFPLWWYSVGFQHAAVRVWQVFQSGNVMLAPGLWLRNIFIPMYGQTDIQGRLMSFFIRLMNVIVRAAALAVWAVISLALLLVWPVFPVALVYLLILSL